MIRAWHDAAGTVVLILLAGFVGCTRSGFGGNGDGGPGGVVPFSFGEGATVTRLSAPGTIARVKHQYAAAYDSKSKEYGVAWIEYPSGSYQRRMMFATLDSAGGIVRQPQAVPAKTDIRQMWLYAGGGGFVLFLESPSATKLTIVRLAFVGGKLDAKVTEDSYTYYTPQVFPDDKGFAVVFIKSVTCATGQTAAVYQVHIRRLDAEGLATGETPQLVDCTGKTQGSPRGLWTGSQYVVAWNDERAGRRVYVAALNPDLTPKAPSQPAFDRKKTQYIGGIAHDGKGRLLVSWSEDHVFHACLDQDGKQLWTEAKQLIADNRFESLDHLVAGGDGSAALLWESDAETVLTQIRFATVDLAAPAPDKLATQLASHTDWSFCCPEIIRGGGGYAVLFRGAVDATLGLFFRVMPD